MFVGWAILSPIAKKSGWAPGPVGDMSTGARGWILWVSLSVMCTDALISLLPVLFEITSKAIHQHRASNVINYDSKETETEERLVPTSWVVYGLVTSILAGTGLVWLVFGGDGIKPWATLLGFIFGGMLSVIG